MIPIYLPNYVPRAVADAEFDRLWNTLDWERRDDAPRREYWQNNYDLPYTYGRGAGLRTYEARPWDAFVKGEMERLNADYGFDLDCCFMNGYENARDWLGWHSDNSEELNDDQPVISLSLGGERDIEIRSMDRTYSKRFLLEHGSVFIMPPGFQDAFEHRIPKVGHEIGPRISLTYRGMLIP